LAGLKNNAVVDCPFDFWTDKATSANIKVSVPASIRSRLGGVAGSVLDVYGGEYEFDNYTVKLHNNRGMNRGVSIRYGKNLTDIQQEQNCSNVATGVYPYWTDINGENLIELPERIVNASGTYNFVKIKTLDLSQVFSEQPTTEQIRNYAQKYIENNNIGVPDVSLSVSFAQLEQSEEYKHLKLLERVSLFDTVNVEFPALGVSANAKVVKIVYDVLFDRVKLATLGSVRANIADTIAEQAKEIEKAKRPNFLQKAIDDATDWLTNGKGYKVERRDDFGNTIDTLYMDTPDVDTAVNVLRIGQSGIGFSHNGVNGPYESAWTIDGKFNADWIYTGTLYGLLFKAGLIESIDGKIKIDLSQESSEPVFNTGISTNGLTVRADEAGAKALIQVKAKKSSGGVNYGQAKFFGVNGNLLAVLTEVFSDLSGTIPVGAQLELYSQDSLHGASTNTTSGSAGFYVYSEGFEVGSLVAKGSFADGTVRSELWTDVINEKAISWEYSNELGKYVLCGE
jgi:phage-related protein